MVSISLERKYGSMNDNDHSIKNAEVVEKGPNAD